jgi:hypothetical protein
MLSSRTLSWIKLATKMLKYTGAAPLIWQKSSRAGESGDRIYLQDFIWFRVIVALHFITLVFYEIFMTYRVFHTILLMVHKENIPLQTFIQLVWNLICYAMPLLIQINQFYRWKEMPSFINGFITFFEEFRSKSQEYFYKQFDSIFLQYS